jgi:hypothetical protein
MQESQFLEIPLDDVRESHLQDGSVLQDLLELELKFERELSISHVRLFTESIDHIELQIQLRGQDGEVIATEMQTKDIATNKA